MLLHILMIWTYLLELSVYQSESSSEVTNHLLSQLPAELYYIYMSGGGHAFISSLLAQPAWNNVLRSVWAESSSKAGRSLMIHSHKLTITLSFSPYLALVYSRPRLCLTTRKILRCQPLWVVILRPPYFYYYIIINNKIYMNNPLTSWYVIDTHCIGTSYDLYPDDE